MTQPPLEGQEAQGGAEIAGASEPAGSGASGPVSTGAENVGVENTAQWAWVQPPMALVPVETEPLEYHRLYRGAPNFKWWKPLVVLVLAASIFFTLNIGLSLLLAPLIFIFDPEYANGAILMQTDPLLDTQHPWSLVLNLSLIIIMIPSVLLAMLAVGIRPTGRVWSVAGRVRWGLLGRTMGAALVGVLVMNGVGIGIDMIMTAVSGDTAPVPTNETAADFSINAAIISMVIVLLLVPFQAAAEEVVFRGLALQVLGSWMKSPWLAIGLSSVVFAAMHIYDIWGLLAVGLMGLVAAWITWKTGGLEAAIAIHVLNNLIAFGFMASGITGETAQVESSGGFELVIGEVVGLAVFAWLTLRIFKKHGYGRERIDVVMRPAPSVPASTKPTSLLPAPAAAPPASQDPPA
ncbi:MAG: lysostaphin resistance A-like protein [Leucobacter sp.]